MDTPTPMRPPRQWMILRLLGLAVRLPLFLIRSVIATSGYPPTRPWISDVRRARVIAWSLIGALVFGGSATLSLYPYFTTATYVALGVLLVVALMIIATCFWLDHGKGPSTDLDGVLTGSEPDHGATDHEKAFILRLITGVCLVWVGGLIYWTGGVLVSPFTTYAVIAVILGQFLSSTAETPFAMMVLGWVLFGWLYMHDPQSAGPQAVLRLTTSPAALASFLWWRLLASCMGVSVAVGINRRTLRPSGNDAKPDRPESADDPVVLS